jgi:hypothetical protein
VRHTRDKNDFPVGHAVILVQPREVSK